MRTRQMSVSPEVHEYLSRKKIHPREPFTEVIVRELGIKISGASSPGDIPGDTLSDERVGASGEYTDPTPGDTLSDDLTIDSERTE